MAKQQKSPKIPELDLHGLNIREAEEALLQFLSDLVMSRQSKAHIIHGHGTGKIKALVHTILSETEIVKRFEIQQFNTGVTSVYL